MMKASVLILRSVEEDQFDLAMHVRETAETFILVSLSTQSFLFSYYFIHMHSLSTFLLIYFNFNFLIFSALFL